ncbi:MAG TPA: RlpA-like double-psi beta-barrel domain-containing protein [Candidatus Limnocylindria bacterium]|nr:RlpA-like double-psi beta-barrel domain-containing protein [Candidatus Limnocylindria bacterium]
MPDLLRRVAVLTLASAVGIALLAPLAVESAPLPRSTEPVRLLDMQAGTSALDRGMSGRQRLAVLTLQEGQAVSAESLEHAPRTLPTPGFAPMAATLRSNATPLPTPVAPDPTAPPQPPAPPAPSAKPPPMGGDRVTGMATWYCCTSGWTGEAVVALPGALGGHYDPPPAARKVTVCADRCVSLPVVDYCGCYWGTANQKVADLSPEAWAAVTDASTSAGVVRVTIHLN